MAMRTQPAIARGGGTAWRPREGELVGPPGRFEQKPDLAIAVFRIFQEALTNVVRHSGATSVEALLQSNDQGLVLTIRDNGQGIPEEEIVRSRSLGLVGMRERALIFGGTVEIKGKKGKGTTVILKVPTPR